MLTGELMTSTTDLTNLQPEVVSNSAFENFVPFSVFILHNTHTHTPDTVCFCQFENVKFTRCSWLFVPLFAPLLL